MSSQNPNPQGCDMQCVVHIGLWITGTSSPGCAQLHVGCHELRGGTACAVLNPNTAS